MKKFISFFLIFIILIFALEFSLRIIIGPIEKRKILALNPNLLYKDYSKKRDGYLTAY